MVAFLLPMLVVCALASTSARAGVLKVTIDSDTATTDDFFEVSVRVNGRHVRLQPPQSADFEIEDATNQFNQPVFCMNMGYEVVSGPCVFSFHFYPKKAGKLTIPGFRAVDDFWNRGRLVGKSAPHEVTVTKGTGKVRRKKTARKTPRRGKKGRGNRRQQTASQGPKVPPDDLEPQRPGELNGLDAYAGYDLFLIPQIERDTLYLNEPFKVDFMLYVGDNSGASSLSGLELPDLEGFRKEQIELEREQRGKVRIGGNRFQVYILARYILIPMEPGERTLAPGKATVLASVQSFQQHSGGFSFTMSGGSTPIEVFSAPLLLDIKEAPKPRPEGFDTANIGTFELAALESPPPQPAGSWMVLKYQIRGTGNLLAVVPPRLPEMPGVETRPPYLDTSGVVVDDQGIHGTVAVQLPFRTKKPGSIPPGVLSLAFFDPLKESFGRAEVEVPELTAIAPVENGDGAAAAPPGEMAGIITDGLLSPVEPGGADGWRWVLLYALALPGLYLMALSFRLILALAGRDTRRRRMKAGMAASRKELKRARLLLEQGRTDRFHAAIGKALAHYLEGRFGIAVGSTTYDRVALALTEAGVPAPLSRKIREELESAEFGRFSPTALQQDDMRGALARTADLIGQLDKCRGEGA